MTWSTEEIYRLLPEILRSRDLVQGKAVRGASQVLSGHLSGHLSGDSRDAENYAPIKTILSLLAREFRLIEDDIDALYDDHFIETCAPWVIPYLADLLGEGALVDTDGSINQRARVADALPLRQRKGTIKALEHAASTASGWPVAGREFWQHLVVSRSMRHVRASTGGSLNIRPIRPSERSGEALDDPFDTRAHGAEIGLIRSGRGRFNLPNIGLATWRLQSMSKSAWPLQPIAAGRRDYRFHALGIDAPLFTFSPRRSTLAERTAAKHVTRAISRPSLVDNASTLYGDGLSVSVTVGGDLVLPEQIKSCHLGDRGEAPAPGEERLWNRTAQADEILIDPVLGRLVIGADLEGDVSVNCHHGFPGYIGGGEYARGEEIGVLSSSIDVAVGEDISDIINNQTNQIDLVLIENGIYNWVNDISLAEGRRVRVVAADGLVPVVNLNGEQTINLGSGAEFEMSGTIITGGSYQFLGNDGNTLARFVDCTLVPGWHLQPSLIPVNISRPSLRFNARGMSARLERTICGPVEVASDVDLLVENSVIDAMEPSAAAVQRNANATGDVASFVASTIIGRVDITAFGGVAYEAALNEPDISAGGGLPATSDTLFFASPEGANEALRAERLQTGCLRFCFVPSGSLTPRRYRCLVDDINYTWFKSLKYGNSSYLQLNDHYAELLLETASNGDELGVWNFLRNSARRANIKRAIEGFLRYGMEAGVEFET